jgi:hypothetical protein
MYIAGKSMNYMQSLGKHPSSLCSAQWGFVLERNPSLAKLKSCPLCTAPTKDKLLEELNPSCFMYSYNFSKADTSKLLNGVQGLTTAKQGLANIKLPQGVKRKLK